MSKTIAGSTNFATRETDVLLNVGRFVAANFVDKGIWPNKQYTERRFKGSNPISEVAPQLTWYTNHRGLAVPMHVMGWSFETPIYQTESVTTISTRMPSYKGRMEFEYPAIPPIDFTGQRPITDATMQTVFTAALIVQGIEALVGMATSAVTANEMETANVINHMINDAVDAIKPFG